MKSHYHQDLINSLKDTKAKIIPIIGAPGSGKDFITKSIFNKLDDEVNQIDLGHALRQSDDPEVHQFISCGKLVPLEKVMPTLDRVISDNITNKICVVNGIPRSMEQANHLITTWGPYIKFMILVEVNNLILQERITNRLVHLPSGRTYNTVTNPPKREGLDDITGEKLVKRSDDTIEVFTKRLEIHNTFKNELMPYLVANKIKVYIIHNDHKINDDISRNNLITNLTLFIKSCK